MTSKRKGTAAYEVFREATPADIAAFGLVVVESDALGACPLWGRYHPAPAVRAEAKKPRIRTIKGKAAQP